MRNPLLIGERVYLRPLEKYDAELYAKWTVEESERFWEERGRFPVSPLRTETWMTETYESDPPHDVQLGICIKEDDRLIGDVGLYGIDYVNRTAETGSYIGDVGARGLGYGPEAKHLILEYAFEHLQLITLISTVWEPNWRSAQAVRRQGYRDTGRYVGRSMRDGKHPNWLVFQLNREDWLAARAAYREHVAGKEVFRA
ncbi:MAG TPA: GNAT family N-acetyltransferase [Thermomicrobiaceae bacterium]|nr:GNAT family N-acetyltransferase [Thermomicrobiaceae bacterium]